MSRTAQTNLLETIYENAIETLGFSGRDFKNERGKLRRALRKAYAVGSQPFIWLDHKGNKRLPSQMATPHLFFAIRMIWNHSVPTFFRIPNVNRYSDVPHWNKDYRQQALTALRKELESRDFFNELDEAQIKQYNYMAIADGVINGVDQIRVVAQ